MEILKEPFDQYDAVHASPPCQAYSDAMKHLTSGYPELIEPVLERFQQLGIPWVVENVQGSPLVTGDTLFGDHGLILCGSMFGLRVRRHRLFQTSFLVDPPRKCDHSEAPMNPHNSDARKRWRGILGEGVPIERTWREEMGVGWMDAHEGRESIPPVYTQHIGYFLRNKV
jgi:DNA (cytosine-5)-methyltransferase 1